MSQPIIIKRRSGHGGHHGGAWKVAYADFVTAMMALFIVLWLLNTSKQVQQAVGGYFRDPSGTSKMVGTDMHGTGENVAVRKEDMSKLKDELVMKIRQMTNFDKLNEINNQAVRIQRKVDSGAFASPEFGGILGSDILRNFEVTFDLSNNRIYVKKNAEYKSDPYKFVTIGIQFVKSDDGYAVMSVWRNSQTD